MRSTRPVSLAAAHRRRGSLPLVRRPRLRIAPEKQALSRYGCRARMTAGQQAGDTMLRPAGPGVAPSLGLPR